MPRPSCGGGGIPRIFLSYSFDPLGTRPHFAYPGAASVLRRRGGLEHTTVVLGRLGWALDTLPWASMPSIVTLALAVTAMVQALPGLNGSFRSPGPSSARRAMGLLVMAFALNLVAFVRWATATGPLWTLAVPTLREV